MKRFKFEVFLEFFYIVFPVHDEISILEGVKVLEDNFLLLHSEGLQVTLIMLLNLMVCFVVFPQMMRVSEWIGCVLFIGQVGDLGLLKIVKIVEGFAFDGGLIEFEVEGIQVNLFHIFLLIKLLFMKKNILLYMKEQSFANLPTNQTSKEHPTQPQSSLKEEESSTIFNQKQKYQQMINQSQYSIDQYYEMCRYAFDSKNGQVTIPVGFRLKFCSPLVLYHPSSTSHRPNRKFQCLIQSICSYFEAEDDQDQELMQEELAQIQSILSENQNYQYQTNSQNHLALEEELRKEENYLQNIITTKERIKNYYNEKFKRKAEKNYHQKKDRNTLKEFEKKKSFQEFTTVRKNKVETDLSKFNNQRKNKASKTLFCFDFDYKIL